MKNSLTYDNWDTFDIQELTGRLKDGLDVLKWAYSTYGPKIVYACSFGAEGMVLLDMIYKVNKQAKVIFLDTDLHFKETYELIDQIRTKYPELDIQMVKPALSVEEQKKQYGDALWKRNPALCCHMRKVEPLAGELSGVDAWITGLRREQSPTRSHYQFVNKDEKFKKIKVCPLVDWKWSEIWMYINAFNLPYNKLHDQGYPSIGCEKCTFPVSSGEHARSGRWAGSGKTECGLHQD